MAQVIVVNMKCGGCVANVKSSMTDVGYKNVNVDLEKQLVSFEGDIEKAKVLLSKMGYPEAGTPEAESLIKKVKSYISCGIGKMKQ